MTHPHVGSLPSIQCSRLAATFESGRGERPAVVKSPSKASQLARRHWPALVFAVCALAGSYFSQTVTTDTTGDTTDRTVTTAAAFQTPDQTPQVAQTPVLVGPPRSMRVVSAGSTDLGSRQIPRFVPANRLGPLREALLTTASGITAQSAPSLAGMDFHSTLLQARRDAGEARQLADRVHQQALDISNRIGDDSLGEPAPQPVQASAPALAAAATASLADQAEEIPQAPSTFSLPALTAQPPELVAGAEDQQLTVPAGVTALANVPAVPTALPDWNAPETALATIKASSKPPRPLPGRMALGLKQQAERAGTGRDLRDGLGIDTTTAKTDKPFEKPQTAGLHTARQPSASSTGNGDRAAARSIRGLQVTPQAAAAYGFVPLSPPKRRTGQNGSRPETARPPAPDHATSSAVAARQPGPTGPAVAPAQPAASAARQRDAAKPGPSPVAANASPAIKRKPAEKAASNFFSWLKPLADLGKSSNGVMVPNDLSAMGWDDK